MGRKKKLSGAQRKKKKMEEQLAMDEALAEFSRLVFGQMTELWTGLVTHHKDIFVSHVLPKLTGTDRFLFSRATAESRALLEYAGVNVSELCLYVHECTSISTLDMAWNKMISAEKCEDGTVQDQAWFCGEVAFTNKLEFLKWAREVKHCEWDERTINEATHEGNLEILKYCFANECPRYESEDVVELTLWFRATTKGHLDCLRFLFDEMEPSREMEGYLAAEAAGCGHLDILKYIVGERHVSGLKAYLSLITCAAKNGHVHCLDYLLEDPPGALLNSPGAWMPLAGARYKKQTEITRCLREKGFPEPTNGQYAFFTQLRCHNLGENMNTNEG
jgi:hypothetical protein